MEEEEDDEEEEELHGAVFLEKLSSTHLVKNFLEF
jgi:hypothetical protein